MSDALDQYHGHMAGQTNWSVPTGTSPSVPTVTSTLALALRIVEFLAFRSEPVALMQIAKEFRATKATVYRHLVTLQRQGFVRQDRSTGRYKAGIKLLVLGEAQRNRFNPDALQVSVVRECARRISTDLGWRP
jgi:DNA-binding IclR family transcriptional regulator